MNHLNPARAAACLLALALLPLATGYSITTAYSQACDRAEAVLATDCPVAVPNGCEAMPGSDCSIMPDGVPILVCVPVVFTDAAGVQLSSEEVAGEACGFGAVKGVCNDGACKVPAGECAGAGSWTVSIEGTGTPGVDEANGDMACGGVNVSKCTTVGNGTASARQCVDVGGSGSGPGECSAKQKGAFNGEIKCEDPPMPGEAGRHIRIIINGNED